MPQHVDAASRRRGQSARGFTLIEIVVALTIAGLALVGLFRAGSGGVTAVGMAARADEAVERAQSRLAEIGRIGPLAAGDSAGDDGDGYRWHVSARPLLTSPIGPVSARRTVTLFEVEVIISWPAGEGRRSVALRSLRLG